MSPPLSTGLTLRVAALACPPAAAQESYGPQCGHTHPPNVTDFLDRLPQTASSGAPTPDSPEISLPAPAAPPNLECAFASVTSIWVFVPVMGAATLTSLSLTYSMALEVNEPSHATAQHKFLNPILPH
eukprot:scaffold3473_cov385-Prasinococcus_capsulatus_cf.AAC.2